MSQKTKIAGWIAVGALAGALTTVSLQTVARGTLAPLPLEELQQLPWRRLPHRPDSSGGWA